MRKKSRLKEASSVIKAIELAWKDAGKPQDFGIKVHDVGEKWLCFTKRPAVVVLTYGTDGSDIGPRESDVRNNRRRGPNSAQSSSRSDWVDRNVKNSQRFDRTEKHNDRTERKQDQDADPKIFLQESRKDEDSSVEEKLAGSFDSSQEEESSLWEDAHKVEVQSILDGVLSSLAIVSAPKITIDGGAMRILFDAPVMSDSESERSFYISLAFLMQQILKKRFKRRFRGCKILFDDAGRNANSGA